MAKVDRHGAAAVLTADQLDSLLAAAPSPRYRCLWAIQRWTAGRISECLAFAVGAMTNIPALQVRVYTGLRVAPAFCVCADVTPCCPCACCSVAPT